MPHGMPHGLPQRLLSLLLRESFSSLRCCFLTG
jgi:hypothetical protein